MRRLDNIVITGVGLLVVLTPLCLGSVHPWAYALMEQIVFALMVAWMARAWLGGGRLLRAGGRGAAAAVAMPIAVLLALLALEMAPLPPALLQRLSPTTYTTYTRALPGWPAHAPYREIDFNASPKRPPRPVFLPTQQQVRAGAPLPFAPSAKPAPSKRAARPAADARGTTAAPTAAANALAKDAVRDGPGWRALSFEPTVTRAGLLKALAYAALFLLVAFYPFGAEGEARANERFSRVVLGSILAMGFLIAFVGLANWASWNGKILWFFVPIDWGGPESFALRASGPFVDPDHFANYLATILPLALVGALLRTDLVERKWAATLRLFSAGIVFVMLCAILLSLSRGGWAATALGVALLVAMFFVQPEERRAVFARRTNALTLRGAALAAAGLFVLALIFVGPKGRNLADVRLTQTAAAGLSLSDRTTLWQGTLAMIRDFPLSGVGLGAWGEAFTRYELAPWSQYFFDRDAHNDYLQFVAEAGLPALLALLWIAWCVLRPIIRALRAGDPRKWPVLAAVVAAAGAMALHETVDFSLHIPANAVLITVLLGLGLRLATPAPPDDGRRRDEIRTRAAPRPLLAGVAAGAIALIFACAGQRDVAYPDYLPAAKTPQAAVARILAHPADASGHFILAVRGANALGPRAQLHELRTAVWLDPTDPYKRDAYAQALARGGRMPRALAEVTRSVFNSPTPATHFYLSGQLLPWLAPRTELAVEKGFKEAVAAHLAGAFEGLGDFYAITNRPLKGARLYAGAAARSRDPARRLDYLLAAGKAFAAAGYMLSAQAFFRIAMDEAPGDPRPYLQLTQSVYGPDRDMRSAKAAIGDAIKAGGDPYDLDLALASAAQQAGDPHAQESALNDALAERPGGAQVLRALGEFYLDQGRYDRAAVTLEQAADTDPAAQIYFELGRAQENGFHYYSAQKSYAQAAALDPNNRAFRDYLVEFKRRMAKEEAQLHNLAAPQPTPAPTPGADD